MTFRQYRMEPIADKNDKFIGYELLTLLPPKINFNSLKEVEKLNILLEQINISISGRLQSEIMKSDVFVSINIR